jgi:putative alpha-1,2-mannosidase
MSAWYIFNAMGFYPVNPVGGEYVFGAPQFKRITLHLPNNKTFTITAKGYSKNNKYVKKITLNQQLFSKKSINHTDIVKGGSLVFDMTDHAQIN